MNFGPFWGKVGFSTEIATTWYRHHSTCDDVQWLMMCRVCWFMLLMVQKSGDHHLGCTKPWKQWDKVLINWCRISSINSMICMMCVKKSNHYLIPSLLSSKTIILYKPRTLRGESITLSMVGYYPSSHNHGSVENWCISNISFLSFKGPFSTAPMGEKKY